MAKPNKLWIDQYGNRYWAKTVKELREKVGGGRISKMYCDGRDGGTFQTGYVIGQHWLSGFLPMREAA